MTDQPAKVYPVRTSVPAVGSAMAEPPNVNESEDRDADPLVALFPLYVTV